MARADVDHYANTLLDRAELIAREINSALAEANRLQGDACGSDDLEHLRKIAFTARYIKDVGRLVDKKLACSSFLGVVTPPFEIRPPDLSTADGHKIWVNTPLRLAEGVTALVVEAGSANAVVDPSAFLDLAYQPFRYAIAMVDPDKRGVVRSWGRRLVDDSVLIARTDKSVDTGIDLIRVDCSKDYFICATAALNRSEAIARQSKFVSGFGALGLLLGGFLSSIGFLLRTSPKPLSTRLREALRSNQLTLVFQPIVDLRSGRMVSAEALIRWSDREGNAIPPDTFISAAESDGTAGEITAYVIRHVTRTAGPMLRDYPEMTITVNIVAADLTDPNFYVVLEQALDASGIIRRQIGLELTERSTARQDIAISAIARLRQLGHPVYLDDFGTGYSSLAHLQGLNLDVIKLDRAFTKSVGTDSVKVSIVPQILEMANALDLRVVVEGIETQAQYAYFASTNPPCYGQGWIISRPLSFDKLVSFKAEH
ncbi:sensor c-di-GMP phosphodiesterase-like protein [Rhizobium sp. BK251]|nr:sensor c-di-GMP phosphodiesterase-like protein [Rhizobium sp. BK251]